MPPAASKPGILCSVQEISQIFGVSVVTVRQWVSAGCPVEARGTRGKAYKLDTAKVSAWLRERDIRQVTDSGGVDEGEAKRRKCAADAGLAEIAFARAKRVVAPIAAVEAAYADELAVLRSRLMVIPDRVCDSLAGMTDPAEIAKALRREVIDALAALSDPDAMVARAADADDDDGR